MDFDLIASEYARHRKIMLPVLDGLRDFVAAIGHKAAVVELGSGTGNYIIALAESTGCTAWGIDCAKGMLAQAVSRGSEVQFAIGDATKLALAADRFDLVYSVDVIHHIGPTGRLISYYQEARRVLKEGSSRAARQDDCRSADAVPPPDIEISKTARKLRIIALKRLYFSSQRSSKRDPL
jgi:ubiquinone/menaquinone biosynthesis C-methylase UbiE